MVETLGAPTPAQIARLRGTFRGDVIEPADAEYDQARRLWNAIHDKRPALVVRPGSVEDVVTALAFARDRGLDIAVRGGGHGGPGHATCDDGIVIDLRALNQVEVDPHTRMARVGGGALLSQLDTAAQAHGLVCPIGVIGHTGVGGLALGGGMGRLQRRFGLTIDNLRAVELVTADGRIVRASEHEEPELFWGIRGAGTQFGVVTSLELELQPFEGKLSRAVRMYDATAAADVWATFDQWARSAPDEFAITLGIGRAVPEADYPDSIAGKPIVFVAFNHAGDPAALDAAIAPLRAGPKPDAEIGGEIRYLDIQTMNDAAMGWGHRSYIDDAFTDGLSSGVLDQLVEHAATAPGDAGIGMSVFGGAVSRVADDATAWPTRSAPYEISADAGGWDDPAEDDRQISWAREAMALIQPIATPFGRYTNSTNESSDEVTRATYGDAKLGRLSVLKAAWDPDNVFRGNHNIRPA